MRNESRSENASLREGATDGKYKKRRPDTTVGDVAGDAKLRADRGTLHPDMNWGYVNSESPTKVNPGA